MKYIHLNAFFLMVVFHTSCGQNKTTVSKEDINSQTKDTVPSYNSNDPNIHTTYEYADSTGKKLVIQNGLPRGGIKYIDPEGKIYMYVMFWSRIINETDNPLELKIHFPVDSYEVPSLPGKYFQILVPPDTITLDKNPLFDSGLTDLKPFLDNNIHKSSSLKRTINPNESSGFYVVIMSLVEGAHGSMRTGLRLKGQDLFYKITQYESKPGFPLIGEKEINCGSINLNLK